MATTYTKVRLTEALVRRATPAIVDGAPRERLYLDRVQPGFGLRVSASGASRSFFVQSRVAGRLVRDTFDPGAKLGVEAARREARRRLGLMATGVDGVAERREERVAAAADRAKGVTLREALELVERTHIAKRRSPLTILGYRRRIEKYLAAWLDRPLVSLSREEVRRRHHSLAAEIARGKYAPEAWRVRGAGFGRSSADSTFVALRAVWNRAVREHPELPVSPTINVDWFPSSPRKAPIGVDGLAALWVRIRAIANPIRRDLWTTMLVTGLRRASECSMRWEDVVLERAIHYGPGPRGGARRACVFPLN